MVPVVAVADSSPVFLRGMLVVLAAGDEFTVLGVGSPNEAKDVLDKSPDVFVADLRLLLDGDLFSHARGGGVPIVVVVPRDRTDDVLQVIGSGVAGIWDRDGEVADLRRIVATALSGVTAVSPGVGAALVERLAATGAAARQMNGVLTRREREILDLMADGAPNRVIADRLFISENTVRNHVRAVLDKLQAATRTEAVVRAMRAGLVRWH